jgi:prophage DNA circulation protein
VENPRSPTSSRKAIWPYALLNWSKKGYTLRARVKRLQDAGKTVINQREQWKSRALAAKALLETEVNRRTKEDDRFDALRRLIAKELHPDFCNGGHLEKLLRQECFKKLWPEIERLADRE